MLRSAKSLMLMRTTQICLRVTSNEPIASPSSMIAFVLNAYNVMPKFRHVFGRNHFNLFIFISRSWGQGTLSRLFYEIIVTTKWYNGDESIQKRKKFTSFRAISVAAIQAMNGELVSDKHPAEICKWSGHVCFHFISQSNARKKNAGLPPRCWQSGASFGHMFPTAPLTLKLNWNFSFRN